MKTKNSSTVTTSANRIVRPAEQVLITGRSLASIWRDQQAGTYPPSIRIGENAVGVCLSSLMEWMNSREVITPETVKPVAVGRRTVGRPRKQPQVEVYPYLDETGNLRFKAMRYEPKGFSQCRPDGNGGWLTTTFDLSKLTRGGDISVGDYFVEFIVERLIPALSIILF